MTARIYVGTYGKYTGGSIEGKWLDADDYGDKDEFYGACRELHADEHDPEFMFQDYEGIPDGMISESHVDSELWDWLMLDDDDQELLQVYRENIDQSGSLAQAQGLFLGKQDSKLDWAYEWIEQTGLLDDIPDHIARYFDYKSWLHDQDCNGTSFVRHDGHVWVFNG